MRNRNLQETDSGKEKLLAVEMRDATNVVAYKKIIIFSIPITIHYTISYYILINTVIYSPSNRTTVEDLDLLANLWLFTYI